MNYQEYLNQFFAAQMAEKLPATEKPWTEHEFKWFTQKLEIKPERMMRLSYKEIYLRTRRIIEKSEDPEKEKWLKEIDETYRVIAEKLNLI